MSFFKQLFGPSQRTADNIQSPVDLVTYMAGLVSNPDAIGPLLDKVRSITSRLQPGESPSPEENKQLFTVYQQIEAYLVTKEPLRSFSKEELRKRIPDALLSQLSDYESAERISQNKT